MVCLDVILIYLPEFEIYHQISGIGAIVILAGLLLMFWNFLSSWNNGELSGTNPWEGTTLEWRLTKFHHVPLENPY